MKKSDLLYKNLDNLLQSFNNIDDIDEKINILISYLDDIKQINLFSIDDKKLINSIYNLSYNLMKEEILTKNSYRLFDYMKNNDFDNSFMVNCILDDIVLKNINLRDEINSAANGDFFDKKVIYALAHNKGIKESKDEIVNIIAQLNNKYIAAVREEKDTINLRQKCYNNKEKAEEIKRISKSKKNNRVLICTAGLVATLLAEAKFGCALYSDNTTYNQTVYEYNITNNTKSVKSENIVDYKYYTPEDSTLFCIYEPYSEGKYLYTRNVTKYKIDEDSNIINVDDLEKEEVIEKKLAENITKEDLYQENETKIIKKIVDKDSIKYVKSYFNIMVCVLLFLSSNTLFTIIHYLLDKFLDSETLPIGIVTPIKYIITANKKLNNVFDENNNTISFNNEELLLINNKLKEINNNKNEILNNIYEVCDYETTKVLLNDYNVKDKIKAYYKIK